ncbi:MAG TPA: ABC transporter substrate-binding protein [Chloroflexia bacterium]|nr:ABC transporter substrate-binding protein [Chloroflexia bacterium]
MKNPVKIWQLLSVSLVTLFLAGLLVACGDNTATPAPAATTSAAATTAASGATTAASATTAAVAQVGAVAPTVALSPASATTAASAATTVASAPAPTATAVPTVAQPAGSTKVVFWYGLTGFNGAVVQQVVNKYNSSQSKYYIEAVQQPDYDATINKLNTSLAGGSLPNVVQVYDIGTQRMIDTKKIIPVQDLIEKDKLDILNDIEPAVRNYYTINNRLYSMPFNSSAPVMYFDKNAFKEAGLDPEKKVWTYDELYDAAKKLVKKDSSGKIVRSAVDFTLYSWIFEQEQATQTALFADPGNGRTERATKLVFNNDAGVNWVNFLKKLQDDGLGRNMGRDGGANSSARDANFVKGEAAITFNSIASLRGYISSAAAAGNKVDVGVAYLPKPAGSKGGVIIGGASLWITNTGSAEQQAGAWDFVKFASQPDIQAFWSSNTGYYPIRKAAYNVKEMQDTLAKYPQFKIAVDELRDTEASPATQGAVFGTFVSARQNIEAAMEQALSGKAGVKAALDDAAKKANDNLSEYNSTVK